MRKIIHVTITILIMLVVSRFVIRLVDATVQIDDDIGLLILLLVILNAGIVGLSVYTFKKSFFDQKAIACQGHEIKVDIRKAASLPQRRDAVFGNTIGKFHRNQQIMITSPNRYNESQKRTDNGTKGRNMQNRGIALAVPLLSCFLPTSAKSGTMTMNFLRYESIIEMECVSGYVPVTHHGTIIRSIIVSAGIHH